MQKVGFLGLGTMGMGMAQNIRQAGFPLTVYNRTQAKAEALNAQGVSVAATPYEAAEQADIIISMVSDDEASREIWLGEQGALAGARPGAVLVECSTLSARWIRELIEHATSAGLDVLDAPVTGSKAAAEAGQLGLFIGGDAKVLLRTRPVLEAMSQSIVHLGPGGSGTIMKLVINLIMAVQGTALAEGLNLAEKAGLNLEQVVPLLANGGVGSPVVKAKIGRMVNHRYDNTEFALHLLHKDTIYAQQLAQALSVPLPTLVTAQEVYHQAGRLGLNAADFAAVIEVARHDSMPSEQK